MNVHPLPWSEVQKQIARALAAQLAEMLQSRSAGYRLTVTDLGLGLMAEVAQQLLEGDLPAGTRVVMVGETGEGDLTVSPTRLIALRNDETVPILVALVPTRFRSYAEDSYREHNFALIDPEPLLLAYRKQLTQELDARGFFGGAIIRRARTGKLEAHLRYLLSVKAMGLDWQVLGAFLPLLGLAPDLELDPASLDARLEDNRNKVAELVDPTRPLVERLERLKLSRAETWTGLYHLLSQYEPQDVEAWGQAIVEEALALKAQNQPERRLSYDNWIESSGEGLRCELEILPLSKSGNPVDEAGDVSIQKDGQIKVRWRWECARPMEVRFVIHGYRDEDELFSSGTIPGNQKSKTINLKGKGVEEGYCQLEMQALSPEAQVLAVAESERFWIEGELPPDVEIVGGREPKWGEEVRCLAEAHCLAAMRLGQDKAPEEVIWQARSRRAPVDTLKIRYLTRTVYHVRLSPTLREFEQRLLQNPQQLGVWCRHQADPGGHEVNFELEPMDLGMLPDTLYKRFREARDRLFERLRDQRPPGTGERFTNVVETADLLAVRAEVRNYVVAYADVMHHYLGARDAMGLLRTLAIDSLAKDEEVVVSPLHPLKLIWALQYQELLAVLKAEALREGKGRAQTTQTFLELITSTNFPPFVPGLDGNMRVNAGQLHMLWSTFSPDPTRYRGIADRLRSALGTAGAESGEAALDPLALSHRIGRYLQLHPFLRQLKLGIVNPGDGSMFLEVVRDLQKGRVIPDLKYDLAFFSPSQPDRAATAFDRLMVEEDENKKRAEDDELVEGYSSLMSPKLVYAKHSLETFHEPDSLLQHHAMVLLDAFKTEIGFLDTCPERSSCYLGHLMNDLVSEFEASQQRVSWAHTVVPQRETDLAALEAWTPLMAEALGGYMRACGFLLSSRIGAWPAVYLPIRERDRRLITLAHQRADWVIFLDKYFDVDFIDHPNSPFCEYYLVDYVPSGHAGLGHKLIVSTSSTAELQHEVAQELGALGLPVTAAPDVVDALQAMSGRLALKQLTTRNLIREAIGLSLLWLKLKEDGQLASAIFVPIDPHADLLKVGARTSEAKPSQRTDAMLIRVDPSATSLEITLIESKQRASLGAAQFIELKSQIAEQLDKTRKDLTALLQSQGKSLDVSRLTAWHDFQSLLLFYLERAVRHGLLSDEVARQYRTAQASSSKPDWGMRFDKEAYVFDLSISGQDEELLSPDIRLVHIGRDQVLRLLGTEPDGAPGPDIEQAEPILALEPLPATTTQEPLTEPGLPPQAQVAAPEPPVMVVAEEPEVEVAAGGPQLERGVPEPPAKEIHGVAVYLGDSVYRHQPVYWEPARVDPRRLTNPHLLLVGTSGAGKTQTTMAFLHELWRHRVPSLILDFHGEYANPDGASFRNATQAEVVNALDGIPVNPLEIPLDPYRRPVGPKRVIWEVSEIIGSIFHVGLQQQRALKRAVEKAYQLAGFTSDQKTWTRRPPSFRTIHEILEDEESTGGNVISTLLSRLDVLFDADVFSDHPSRTLDELLHQPTVVDLSRLYNNEHRLVVARFFLQKIYNQMLLLGESLDLRLFVTIDEAHRLSYDETLLKLIKEARKYGIGILLASQEPADFPPTALELPGTRIFLQQGPRGAKAIAPHLEPTDAKRRQVIEGELQSLDVGQAYIRSMHYLPFEKVQIRFFYQRVSG